MEHVFGGVYADSDAAAARDDAVTTDVRPVLAADNTSVVHVTVNAMPEQRPQPPEPKPVDRHDEYESDRRGEHKYPHDEDRPSQRERDELKSRLQGTR